MHQSKLLKTIILALLLLWSTAQAQLPRKGEQPAKAAGEIPEMPVWWQDTDVPELPNNHYVGEGVTFLPNFYNGQSAMALRTANDEIHTWLNRFPGDTQNVFTWKAGYIKSGDFNGDGIMDYIDGSGNIYRGIQNGQPPEKKPIFKYNFSGIIHDLNQDGFDDIFWRSDAGGYGVIARVLYGGKDFTKFAQVNIERTTPFDTNRSVDQIYFTPEGEARFLVYHSFKDGIDVIKGYEIYKVI